MQLIQCTKCAFRWRVSFKHEHFLVHDFFTIDEEEQVKFKCLSCGDPHGTIIAFAELDPDFNLFPMWIELTEEVIDLFGNRIPCYVVEQLINGDVDPRKSLTNTHSTYQQAR